MKKSEEMILEYLKKYNVTDISIFYELLGCYPKEFKEYVNTVLNKIDNSQKQLNEIRQQAREDYKGIRQEHKKIEESFDSFIWYKEQTNWQKNNELARNIAKKEILNNENFILGTDVDKVIDNHYDNQIDNMGNIHNRLSENINEVIQLKYPAYSVNNELIGNLKRIINMSKELIEGICEIVICSHAGWYFAILNNIENNEQEDR